MIVLFILLILKVYFKTTSIHREHTCIGITIDLNILKAKSTGGVRHASGLKIVGLHSHILLDISLLTQAIKKEKSQEKSTTNLNIAQSNPSISE